MSGKVSHGRLFCYCRERKYGPRDDPIDFAYVIQVKENAPELLRRVLSQLPVDLVMTGDYQVAESRYLVSRRMLEVYLELSLPVWILEGTPLGPCDLNLLKGINARAPSVVFLSLISSPDTSSYDRARWIENLVPRIERRWRTW